VKAMAGKKTKNHKGKQLKPTRKPNRTVRPPADRKALPRLLPKDSKSTPASAQVVIHSSQPVEVPSRPIFSIEIASIGGETTLGDLIVAFPRTRDVLVRHGLRLDVEEAGYLYMTLNVFSAIHGLATNSLVEELHTASKELPPQSSQPQIRTVATPPAT